MFVIVPFLLHILGLGRHLSGSKALDGLLAIQNSVIIQFRRGFEPFCYTSKANVLNFVCCHHSTGIKKIEVRIQIILPPLSFLITENKKDLKGYWRTTK